MLEALGNIGDFLGGIGVVVTLIYLASQIRQNTKSTRMSAFQAAQRDIAVRSSTRAPGHGWEGARNSFNADLRHFIDREILTVEPGDEGMVECA